MPSPAFTLTAHLETIIGGADTLGFLEITLCGFGPVIPSISGSYMLADAGVPQLLGPGTLFSELLWGNDVIDPPNTFYAIAVLDEHKNVIQAANYKLTGGGTHDLSSLTPLVPPYGFEIGDLVYQPCTGAVPGNTYVAPSNEIIAVAYNGVLMPYGVALPVLSYTAVGTTITLNFNTQAGDRIDAICVL